jgi:antirestriction protein
MPSGSKSATNTCFTIATVFYFLLLVLILVGCHQAHAELTDCVLNGTESSGCTDEDRKWIKAKAQDVHAASMAKQASEYEAWQQGAEARRLDSEARQAALLKQELAEAEKQYRAAEQQRHEDQERRNAAQLHEQQAAIRRRCPIWLP